MGKRRSAATETPRSRVRTPARPSKRTTSNFAAATLAPAATVAPRWTFLSNHSHVLILLAQHPSMVLREVAAHVGITERAVHRIIADLEESGYIQRVKVGRQNQYELSTKLPLRHPVEGHCSIGDLIKMVIESR